MAQPSTLVDALSRLPRGPERGFRFIAADASERFFSYETMEHEARRRAALLASLGVEKGDRVALVIPEGHDFVLTFLAATIAGAVPVPIFPRATFKATSDYLDTIVHICEASSRQAAAVQRGKPHAGRAGARACPLADAHRQRRDTVRQRAHRAQLRGPTALARGPVLPAVHLGQHLPPQGRDGQPRQPDRKCDCISRARTG